MLLGAVGGWVRGGGTRCRNAPSCLAPPFGGYAVIPDLIVLTVLECMLEGVASSQVLVCSPRVLVARLGSLCAALSSS